MGSRSKLVSSYRRVLLTVGLTLSGLYATSAHLAPVLLSRHTPTPHQFSPLGPAFRMLSYPTQLHSSVARRSRRLSFTAA